jgi:hypothetical protein
MAVLALRGAAETGDAGEVKRLFTEGLTPEEARDEDNYALRVAARRGHHEVVRALFGRGLTADDARARNKEALARAVARGFAEVLQVLLENGMAADVREGNALSAAALGSSIAERRRAGPCGASEVLRLLARHISRAEAAMAGPVVVRAWKQEAAASVRVAMLCCGRARARGPHVPPLVWARVLDLW